MVALSSAPRFGASSSTSESDVDEKLKIVNNFVLARALKEFAASMGMREKYADILAQVHVASSPILQHWPRFFEQNCLRRRHDPDGCEFLHPTSCVKGATPGSTRQANITVVELGQLQRCPCFEPG